MRKFLNGFYVVALMFSTHLAAAASAPSLSGTEIPSAAQIVDSSLNTWTLSGGEAYENGKVTPSSEVILLLCYGGSVFQENIHHNWWVWDLNTSTWAAFRSAHHLPRGRDNSRCDAIVDSALNVWTVSGGQAYEKWPQTLERCHFAALRQGLVYQENSHHDWWQWRTGAWVTTSAPAPASASGTTIPSATQIVDSGPTSGPIRRQAYENHELTPSSKSFCCFLRRVRLSGERSP